MPTIAAVGGFSTVIFIIIRDLVQLFRKCLYKQNSNTLNYKKCLLLRIQKLHRKCN